MDDVRTELKNVITRAHALGYALGHTKARNESTKTIIIAWCIGAVMGFAAGWVL